ncbi:YceI family protein [Streptomyces spectabilis]|uniref:Polyisoprenoid-binding protein n=1 Tax=Streptomyces spectabilis TaxID=68270 RepID=A0A5P2WYT1_STRST|nr:YceI family protein [Streptomyces spectabilis]MBB5101128.1 polyisoprenoid-binding protein YceI [Streptomyces spectabilis]MCI3900334.1 YceI family protein [Streptomyces spectabilis]QEV57923.1 polyisoprenoid-binding protein [Streptomyces spectabilis]GGV09521.1 polyisoprenoid-binding protein [Streptomyces spectabilis]
MSISTELSELTGEYVIDPAHTRIGFVARHTMSTRVRGQFAEFGGGARLDGGDPSRSSAQLTIHARSIQTRNQQRDDLLCGKFLDVDNHPAITFTSAHVRHVDGARYKVAGDLTIRGVTAPVTLDVELTTAAPAPEGDFRVGFTGSATINRRDWGVNWNSMTALMVGPKVTLEFDVTAVRTS